MPNNTTMTAREQRRVLKNWPGPITSQVAIGYEDGLEFWDFTTKGDQTGVNTLAFILTCRDRNGTAVTSARRARLSFPSPMQITITTGTVVRGVSGTDAELDVDSDATGVIAGTVGHATETITNGLFEVQTIGELGPTPLVDRCTGTKRVTIT